MNNNELLKELKKIATKSNTRIINNKHNIIDSLVSITMAIASAGTENGMVTDLSRQFIRTSKMCYNFLDNNSDLKNHKELKYILKLCNDIYEKLDDGKIIIIEPIGYRN